MIDGYMLLHGHGLMVLVVIDHIFPFFGKVIRTTNLGY
jgi:hypothetical protein